MSHLSPEQFAECISSPPGQAAARHLEECGACRAEVANFRAALGEFRGAVRSWSQQQADAALAIPARLPESRSWIAAHQLALALLLAAVFVLASFVLPRQGRESAPGGDAGLLNEVDGQVSRTVPSSMEPLTKLVVQE